MCILRYDLNDTNDPRYMGKYLDIHMTKDEKKLIDDYLNRGGKHYHYMKKQCYVRDKTGVEHEPCNIKIKKGLIHPNNILEKAVDLKHLQMDPRVLEWID